MTVLAVCKQHISFMMRYIAFGEETQDRSMTEMNLALYLPMYRFLITLPEADEQTVAKSLINETM